MAIAIFLVTTNDGKHTQLVEQRLRNPFFEGQDRIPSYRIQDTPGAFAVILGNPAID